MSFTVWYYPFFLLGVAGFYWQLGHRGRTWLLLSASCLFYGAWDWRFLSLIAASTLVDYFCTNAMDGRRMGRLPVLAGSFLPIIWLAGLGVFGLTNLDTQILQAAGVGSVIFFLLYEALWRMEEGRRRRAFLLLSVVTNLTILGFFKYFGFFVDSAQDFLAMAGFGGESLVVEILLPVGISFYTFQSVSFAVDVYYKRIHACGDLPTFAAFIAFFPQLVAGPIERGRQLLTQLEQYHVFDVANLHAGMRLILVGYFKKVFVANNCAIIANYVFSNSGNMDIYWMTLGVLAFAFQIYGDFSGYTDIARGSALLFGVRLERNFAFPYLARSPSDFWARWHITLSTWIRDYLYIPLGGNRHGTLMTVRNLYIAMLLAGLWHGATWMFVLWGFYHATLLVLYRVVPFLHHLEHAKGHRVWLSSALMFLFTLLGWLIFRSPDWPHFMATLHAFSVWPGSMTPDVRYALAWLAFHVLPLLVLQYVTRKAQDESALDHRPWALRGLDYTVMFLLVTSSAVIDVEFIYFQF